MPHTPPLKIKTATKTCSSWIVSSPQSVTPLLWGGGKEDFEDEKENVSRVLKLAGVIARAERTETSPSGTLAAFRWHQLQPLMLIDASMHGWVDGWIDRLS